MALRVDAKGSSYVDRALRSGRFFEIDAFSTPVDTPFGTKVWLYAHQCLLWAIAVSDSTVGALSIPPPRTGSISKC